MVYLSTIPAAGDRPSQSQPQILENFNQLNTQYGTTGDHVEFTASTNNGKHKRSTLVEQPGDQTTLADEMSLYTKNNGGTPDLYLRRESNGTVLQLTDNSLVASSGNGLLSNGLQIRSGSGVASPGAGSANAIIPPFPTATISVTANTKNGNNPVGINGAVAANSFTATSDGAVNIFWTAIGY